MKLHMSDKSQKILKLLEGRSESFDGGITVYALAHILNLKSFFLNLPVTALTHP